MLSLDEGPGGLNKAVALNPNGTPATETATVDETVEVKKKKSRKISVSAMYHGTQPGKKPSREILNNVTQFRRKHAGKTIDVWWMYVASYN